MAKAYIKINKNNLVEVSVLGFVGPVSTEVLTFDRNSDRLLITALDRVVGKSRIARLRLKTLIISGDLGPGTVSGMVVGAVKAGLEC